MQNESAGNTNVERGGTGIAPVRRFDLKRVIAEARKAMRDFGRTAECAATIARCRSPISLHARFRRDLSRWAEGVLQRTGGKVPATLSELDGAETADLLDIVDFYDSLDVPLPGDGSTFDIGRGALLETRPALQ